MRKTVNQAISFFLALLLTQALVGCGAAQQTEPSGEGSASAPLPVSSVAEEAEEEPEPVYISYPGFVDQAFTSKHHELTLAVPEDSAVSFRFTVSYKGETLFRSDAVAPGDSVKWDVMEKWSERGHHTVTVTSVPILEDGSEGNASAQVIRLTLNFD